MKKFFSLALLAALVCYVGWGLANIAAVYGVWIAALLLFALASTPLMLGHSARLHANEFARNVKDALLTVTRALPTADGTVTSSDLDLEAVAAGRSLENVELSIEIPELSSTLLPSADTLTVTVQGGASATPSTSLNIVKVITGTGSTIAAQEWRVRLPSDCPRYINVKFVAAGGTGDQSGVSATVALRF